MRHIACVLSLVLPLLGAEPRAAAEAELQFNREYNAAKEEFDRKVKVAKDRYIAMLRDEMKRLTTKGDLDGAVYLRDKIKAVEAEVVTEKNQKEGGATGAEKQVEARLRQLLCGTNWVFSWDGGASSREMTFSEEGKILKGANPRSEFSWKVVGATIEFYTSASVLCTTLEYVPQDGVFRTPRQSKGQVIQLRPSK